MAKKYEFGDDTGALTPAQLRRADRDTKKKAMQTWFFRHFSDPVEVCPYESAEGGYQFIWGGPYEPLDELQTEFSRLVPNDLIKQVASEMSDQAPEWSGKPDRDEDNYLSLMDAVKDNFAPLSTLNLWLGQIRDLLKQEVPPRLREHYDQLLFVSAITALETFLSDCFTNEVASSPDVLRRFVETTPEFEDETLPLSHIYRRMELIGATVRAHLSGLLWHNLAKVKPMYKQTLDCNFPKDISRIAAAIATRHDIVHRGGKNKKGEMVHVSAKTVTDLVNQIESLAVKIDKQIPTAGDF